MSAGAEIGDLAADFLMFLFLLFLVPFELLVAADVFVRAVSACGIFGAELVHWHHGFFTPTAISAIRASSSVVL